MAGNTHKASLVTRSHSRTHLRYYHQALYHYDDVIMDTNASQITSLAIVYPIVYSSADQRKHQSSASLAFVRGIHRGPVNSPHKWPVTRKMFPFDDVIMLYINDLVVRYEYGRSLLLVTASRNHTNKETIVLATSRPRVFYVTWCLCHEI